MIGTVGIKTSLPPVAALEFEPVLVITMGSKPGAVTTPLETILTGAAELDEEDSLSLVTVACTSRMGAPRSIAPVANCLV